MYNFVHLVIYLYRTFKYLPQSLASLADAILLDLMNLEVGSGGYQFPTEYSSVENKVYP